jgi:hypothetical protein
MIDCIPLNAVQFDQRETVSKRQNAEKSIESYAIAVLPIHDPKAHKNTYQPLLFVFTAIL